MRFQGERIDERVIKRTSERVKEPIDLVKKIHQYQFRITRKGFNLGSSIEVTGLGSFRIGSKLFDKDLERVTKRIKELEEDLNAPKRDKLLGWYKKELDFLNSKHDKFN